MKIEDPALQKVVYFGTLIFLFILLFRFTFLAEYITRENLINSRKYLQKLSENSWFPFAFVLFYACGVVVALPGTIMAIAGGVIFGTFKGVLLNVAASNIGANLSFLIARNLGRDFMEKILKGKFKIVDDKIGENGFLTILRLRLIPLVPFNFINYAAGFSKVSHRQFALGSLIGMLPGTIVYTFFSSAILIDPEKQKQAFLKLFLAILLLISISFLPKLIKKKSANLEINMSDK